MPAAIDEDCQDKIDMHIAIKPLIWFSPARLCTELDDDMPSLLATVLIFTVLLVLLPDHAHAFGAGDIREWV